MDDKEKKMEMKKVAVRAVYEREKNKQCKWCGRKMVNQMDWENTCYECGDKTHEERGRIFNKSIENSLL